MNQEQKIARLRLVADGLRRIQEFESARYLDEYAATLKAAHGGVTEAMYRGALQAWIDRAELDFPARLLAALEAALSAEPAAPCSLNEAMEVMEVWADHGGQVHGEAAARLRALADRIAPEPAAQPEDSRCPPTYRREEAVKALIGMGWTWDGKAWAEPAAQAVDVGAIQRSDVWVVQDEAGHPIHCAGWPQACREHIREAINEHGIEEARAWKVLHYTNGATA